jgi:glycosyltransferase involved in cell wall biosynthesis
VSFVLPARDEEDNIVEAIDQTCVAAERLCSDYEVIVVDDGSIDATAVLTERAGAANPKVRLVRHGTNKGYGEALRTGFAHSSMDLVFFTDADNQFDLDELGLLLPWIDHVDVVAGYRIRRQDTFGRRVVARAWNMLVRVLFHVPLRDIDCAFKLFRRAVLDEIDIESVGAVVNTELIVKLGRAGTAVAEVGVTHRPRVAGQARGASPEVVLRAVYELTVLYRRLRRLDRAPTLGSSPSPSIES